METELCPFNGVECEYIPLADKVVKQADEIERLRGLLGDVLIMSSEDIPYWLQQDIRAALKETE